MKARTVVILVLVFLAAVLVIQNSQLTELRLAFWSVYAPQFILVLIVLALGLVAGYLAGRRGRKNGERTQAEPPPSKPALKP